MAEKSGPQLKFAATLSLKTVEDVCRALTEKGYFTALSEFVKNVPAYDRVCTELFSTEKELEIFLEALNLLGPAYRGDIGLRDPRATSVGDGEALKAAVRSGNARFLSLRQKGFRGRELQMKDVTPKMLEEGKVQFEVEYTPDFVEQLLGIQIPICELKLVADPKISQWPEVEWYQKRVNSDWLPAMDCRKDQIYRVFPSVVHYDPGEEGLTVERVFFATRALLENPTDTIRGGYKVESSGPKTLGLFARLRGPV